MSRLTSPTAQLLRSSRLFSIPPPLPRPAAEDYRNGVPRISDSATTPYPTHQVITTPDSSRARGDWGLKRPLPGKSAMRNSEAALRITSIDTIEQITDFESGLDHVKTLRKLQELHLAITRPDKTSRSWHDDRKNYQQPSAFEPALDQTTKQVINTNGKIRPYTIPPRWKHRGPAIQAMNGAEFEQFMESEVHGKAGNFNRVLELEFCKQFIESMSFASITAGNVAGRLFYGWLGKMSDGELLQHISQVVPKTFAETIQSRNSTPQLLKEDRLEERRSLDSKASIKLSPEYHAIIKEFLEQESSHRAADEIWQSASSVENAFAPRLQSFWRDHFYRFRSEASSEEKYRSLIETFLDLPRTVNQSHSLTTSYDIEEKAMTTHPSAGLSYHRTPLVLENHPLFGPVRKPRPHRARTLPVATLSSALRTKISDNMSTTIGIAGISAEGQSSLSIGSGKAGASLVSDDAPKGWVYPKEAHINSAGRIILRVAAADQPAVRIVENAHEREREEMLAIHTPRAEPLELPFGTKGRLETRLDGEDTSIEFTGSEKPKHIPSADVNEAVRRAFARPDPSSS